MRDSVCENVGGVVWECEGWWEWRGVVGGGERTEGRGVGRGVDGVRVRAVVWWGDVGVWGGEWGVGFSVIEWYGECEVFDVIVCEDWIEN